MERQIPEKESQFHLWRSRKLVIDPALTKGLYKVYRYDGERFSLPVSNHIFNGNFNSIKPNAECVIVL